MKHALGASLGRLEGNTLMRKPYTRTVAAPCGARVAFTLANEVYRATAPNGLPVWVWNTGMGWWNAGEQVGGLDQPVASHCTREGAMAEILTHATLPLAQRVRARRLFRGHA